MLMPMMPPPSTRKSEVSTALPDLPGRSSRTPEFLEVHPLLDRIHAGPESGVPVAHQLAIVGQSFYRLALPGRVVAFDVVQRLRLQDEEAPVDPAFRRLRLLVEFPHLVSGEADSSEPGRRAHRGDGRQLAMGRMESEQGTNVDVGDPIPI